MVTERSLTISFDAIVEAFCGIFPTGYLKCYTQTCFLGSYDVRLHNSNPLTNLSYLVLHTNDSATKFMVLHVVKDQIASREPKGVN